MKLKIKSTKDGSFEDKSTGDVIPYYYYRAENQNGELIEFGSVNEYDKGQDVDVNIIRDEIIDKNGKSRIRLKEAGGKGWD